MTFYSGDKIVRLNNITICLLLSFFILLPVKVVYADVDTDGDGLTDFEEQYIYYTYIDNVDSDGDGLEDGDEVYIYGTNPTYLDINPFDGMPDGWDTDNEGFSDGAEVFFWGTDPTNSSTDGDPYDDYQEIWGTSIGGTPMPAYVQAPGDNVFVAAYPVIEIVVDSTISVEEIPIITFGSETWEEGTQGYAVAETQGSSYSVGTTSSYTTGEWIEHSNAEEDSTQQSSYTEQVSTSEAKSWTGYSQGNKTEVEVGAEVGVTVSAIGPAAYGKVYGSVKNTVETGSYADNYQGHTNTMTTGGQLTTEKIRKTSTSRGAKNESTFSTTITRTTYNETTVTNSNSIATGEKWVNATTTDTNNAGKLRFQFWIMNTGSDIANEINDLRFNIYIGDNLPITIPPIDDPGYTKYNLSPGDTKVFSVDVQITLEELRAIDEGESIKIKVADYSYGAAELDFLNAWGRDVLVEINDGIEDGDESIDYYMTYVNYGETYLNALERLNTEVQIGHPSNKRTEIELTVEDNYITSVVNKPVTEWSWWNVYIQDLENTAERFAYQPATKQTRLQLIYHQDSDHDFYTDRTEIKIGTSHQDINSHPSPILIVGKIKESSDENETIKLKFTNAGNYDAYGIEAVLYSPDSTTTVTNSLIGGGGRIEAGRTFIPDETFEYTENIVDCNEPEVLVRYNDPQGTHTFITKLETSNNPNDNIENYAYNMLESDLSVSIYTYQTDSWIAVDYYNPGSMIHDANLTIYYQDADDVIDTVTRIVDIETGDNSFFFGWNPYDQLGLDAFERMFKAVVIISDYQGIEIDYDVQKFTLSPTNYDKTNLNEDGIINIADFSIFARNFRQEGFCFAGDIDENGIVDPNDLLFMAEYWLYGESPTHALYFCSTSGGSVFNPGEGGFKYDPNAVIPIEAQSEIGHKFVNWTGDIVDGSVGDPLAISTTATASSNGIFRANFEAFALTINSTNGGSVSTPGEGKFSFDNSTIVNIVAENDLQYYFVKWTGTAVDKGKVTDPDSATTTVLVDGDYTLYAEFSVYLFEVVFIPAGTFDMGDHFDEGHPDERPVHTVTLDSFYMSKHEITNQQYVDFLNSAYPAQIKVDSGIVYAADDVSNSFPYCNTSTAVSSFSQIDYSIGVFSVNIKDGTTDMSNHPMVEVSWYGCVAYCNWTSQQEGLQSCYDLSTWECDFTKNGFRLPTEAQWEYAARGGNYNPYYRYPWGDSIDCSMANYNFDLCGDLYETGAYPWTTPIGYYNGGQTPAGIDMRNGYGLYDMAGNAYEWCNDWFDLSYYSDSVSPTNNPTGPVSSSNSSRVMRGGYWGNGVNYCRVADRNSDNPVNRSSYIGFRVCVFASH